MWFLLSLFIITLHIVTQAFEKWDFNKDINTMTAGFLPFISLLSWQKLRKNTLSSPAYSVVLRFPLCSWTLRMSHCLQIGYRTKSCVCQSVVWFESVVLLNYCESFLKEEPVVVSKYCQLRWSNDNPNKYSSFQRKGYFLTSY